jgi:hypothetical protein
MDHEDSRSTEIAHFPVLPYIRDINHIRESVVHFPNFSVVRFVEGNEQPTAAVVVVVVK